DDFLSAQKMLRRMGPLQGTLKLMPGMSQLANADIDESRMKRVEAIVLSMTPRERSLPHVIDGKRRIRIANGSGTSVQEVNQLLEGRKMMEKMMGQMGKGKMPALPGMDGLPGAGVPGAPARTVAPLERRSGGKKRKANKKRSGRR